MIKEIILWGGTGHAKVLRELVGHVGYRVTAVFDNNPDVAAPFPDVPIYYGTEGFFKWKEARDISNVSCLVAIGGARGRDRLSIQSFLEGEGLRPAIAVHPTAFVAENASLAKGCQVLAQATVCAEAKVGEACIINTASSVDHECILGRGVHIGPGATLAGCVSVGDYSFVGSGAVVLPRVKIGSTVIVGAGAVVTRDVPDGKVAFGNPAKVHRDNL